MTYYNDVSKDDVPRPQGKTEEEFPCHIFLLEVMPEPGTDKGLIKWSIHFVT